MCTKLKVLGEKKCQDSYLSVPAGAPGVVYHKLTYLVQIWKSGPWGLCFAMLLGSIRTKVNGEKSVRVRETRGKDLGSHIATVFH